MTSLGLALLLGSVHASVVAAATLLARRCLPARMAAGRVTIGAVGMGCVLAVTRPGLAATPRPVAWKSFRRAENVARQARPHHNRIARRNPGFANRRITGIQRSSYRS